MGLFDTVRCLYPLPDSRHQALSFQTKDLGCRLDDYTITRSGHLRREPGDGLFRRGVSRAVRVALHGDLVMYGDLGLVRSRPRGIEYRARFTAGRIEWIKPESPAPTKVRRPSRRSFPDERGAMIPGIGARRISPHEFGENTPEKLELFDGRVVGDERLLLLILTSLGLRYVIGLLGNQSWQAGLWAAECETDLARHP